MRRERRLEALVLTLVLATVTVLGSYRSARPVEWAPAAAQMSEAPRQSPSPADRVEAQVQVELGAAIFPHALLPLAPRPTAFHYIAPETDGCRPGYRSRIDHPPRAGA